MASIGEVTATLKANVSQYITAMQQAGKSTAEIQQSVENATKALLAEGAAGQAAGKGLAGFGASTQQLAQQLAAAEGRLTQMKAGFSALGIAPAGKEFERVTAQVAALQAQMAQVAPVLKSATTAFDASKVVSVGNAMAQMGAQSAGAAQQVAALKARLTDLERVKPDLAGTGFGRLAAAELLVVRRQLDATTQSAQNLAPAMQNLGGAGQGAGRVLNSLRGSLANVAAAAVGVPGPVGNIASKLLMFGVGGAVTVAVTTGLAAVAFAFTKLREKAVAESKATEDAVEGLVQRYREATGAIARENKERAQSALQAAQQALEEAERGTAVFNRGTGGVDRIIDPAAVREAEALVNDLTRAVQQANDELEAFNKPKAEGRADALREAAAAAAAAVAAETERIGLVAREGRELQGLLNLNTGLDGLLTSQLTTIQKQLQEVRNQKQAWEEVAAVQDAIREAEAQKTLQNTKSDSTVKDAVAQQRQDASEAMRGVADAMARGFLDAFQDHETNLAKQIGQSLIRAAREALAQFLAAKVFGGFLSFLFGGGGKGGIPIVSDIPVIGKLFSAPSVPAPEAVGGMGGGVTIDLSSLPRPMSAIEMARDDMWRTVWVETARQAQLNGVNLQPRF